MAAGIRRFEHPVRFAFLLGAALLTSVIVYLAPPSGDSGQPRPRLTLGYYVKDALLTGTGPDGHVLYRVHTVAAEQRLRDGTITMQDVDVNYDPSTDVPWDLHADHGQIPPDRNIIELTGNVVATTRTTDSGPASPPPLLIRTDYLELDPEAYIARTERMVAVERARDTLRARGMRVYLKQDRLQFNAEVRGRFLP